MRTLGGAVGTQVAASVLAATLAANGTVTHRGFAIAFGIGATMLALATLAALAAPRGKRAGAQDWSALQPALTRKA